MRSTVQWAAAGLGMSAVDGGGAGGTVLASTSACTPGNVGAADCRMPERSFSRAGRCGRNGGSGRTEAVSTRGKAHRVQAGGCGGGTPDAGLGADASSFLQNR